MSRRTISTLQGLQPVRVTMGWDRPAQQVFASVQAVGERDPHKMIYDSMEDGALKPFGSKGAELDYFLDKLMAQGVFVEETLARQLYMDITFNAGNEISDLGKTYSESDLPHIAAARQGLTEQGLNPDEPINVSNPEDGVRVILRWLAVYQPTPEKMGAERPVG